MLETNQLECLGPIAYQDDLSSGLFKYDYFKLTNIYEQSLILKESNSSNYSLLVFPTDFTNKSIVIVPNFYIKTDLSDYFVENNNIQSFEILNKTYELYVIDFIELEFDYSTYIEENTINQLKKTKTEVFEYNFYIWATKSNLIYSPMKLATLGIVFEGNSLSFDRTSRFVVCSLPNTITNFLTPLRISPKKIINSIRLFNISIGSFNFSFYKLNLEFDYSQLLFKSSVRYETTISTVYSITNDDLLDGSCSNFYQCLDNYKVYRNQILINTYISLNSHVNISKHFSNEYFLNSNSFIYNLLLNFEDYNPIGVDERLINLLKRFFNQSLIQYERGINWIPNSIYQYRYFKFNNGYFFDSYNGLLFNSDYMLSTDNIVFDWNGPFDNYDGDWTDEV